MDSSAHDTSKTADQVMARPKIIHITLNDLERPVFEGTCTEAKYLKTRSMCQDIIADLRCVQKAYVFQPKHFDRETIREHLKVIVAEYHLLRNDPSRFASSDEYKEFLATMHTLTADTTQVIRAVKARYQLRLKVQNDINKEISLAGNQRHLPHLSPWSQYLAPGAPSLPAARFLPPFETRPPTDVSFPDHRRISRTSVQALPQAATAILGTWALEFQKANDFYHQRYPEEREFAGPLQRKLVPFRQMTLTPTGLKTEALRLHNLGNRPYAHAIELINIEDPEAKFTLGKFLGMLQRKDVVTPLAANRCYVIRRWVLEEVES